MPGLFDLDERASSRAAVPGMTGEFLGSGDQQRMMLRAIAENARGTGRGFEAAMALGQGIASERRQARIAADTTGMLEGALAGEDPAALLQRFRYADPGLATGMLSHKMSVELAEKNRRQVIEDQKTMSLWKAGEEQRLSEEQAEREESALSQILSRVGPTFSGGMVQMPEAATAPPPNTEFLQMQDPEAGLDAMLSNVQPGALPITQNPMGDAGMLSFIPGAGYGAADFQKARASAQAMKDALSKRELEGTKSENAQLKTFLMYDPETAAAKAGAVAEAQDTGRGLRTQIVEETSRDGTQKRQVLVNLDTGEPIREVSGWGAIPKTAVGAAAPAAMPKPPTGYRWTEDGELEAIKGGPAAQKVAALTEKKQNLLRGIDEKATIITKNIDDALGKAGWMETGLVGSVVGKIPGSDAYDMRSLIDTVKANIGFQELTAMRQASPTGGALGQVAVQELNFLQSALGNLDPKQSTDQLKKALGAVKAHFMNWRDAVRQDMAEIGTDAPAASGGDPESEAEAYLKSKGL